MILVKLEILVNEEPVDALATDRPQRRRLPQRAGDYLQAERYYPRQLFVVPIQAYAAGRVISRANVKACAKMSWPNATAATSRARRSCSKSRSAAKSA
jgi:GTP-binding protein LepA